MNKPHWLFALILLFSSLYLASASYAKVSTTGFDCNNVIGVSITECQALVAFYNSTDGPNWTNNDEWLVTNTPCSWFGITCGGFGWVERLTLPANGLNGSLPPELEDLYGLEYLYLPANGLNGSLPPELGNLPYLQYLYLSVNQLSGSLPPELGNLSSLHTLLLDANQLSGSLPPELGNLPYLSYLTLSNNQLSGPLPTELTNLNLYFFHFDQTKLCEPSDLEFQNWLASIPNLQGTGIFCEKSFSISGQVMDENSNPIADVTISNASGSTLTDANGYYTITNLITDTYTLTPLKAGYTFSPSSQDISVPPDATDVDFLGTLSSLTVSHIEISQVVQDESNDVVLIEGKPTFVRVYVDCGAGCSSLPNITGILRGYGSGGELPNSPLLPVNLSVTAEHPDYWIDQRDDLKKTLNFTIPPDWANGIVTFTAEVAGVELSETRPFQEANSISVTYVPIRYQGQLPNLSYIQKGFWWAKRNFPTENLNYHQGIPINWNKCLEDDDSACPNRRRNVEELKIILNIISWFTSDFVYGWLPPNSFGGGDSDPTWLGGAGKVAFGDEYVDNKDIGERIFAHEIAHLLNRRHTNTNANLSDSNCKTNNGSTAFIDPKSDWVEEDGNPGVPPFPDSKIQDFGLDGFGFGWLISSNNAIKNPIDVYDYMSYCGKLSNYNVWTSPWTYERIYDELLSTNLLQLRPFRTTQSYFIANGLVFTDNTAILNSTWVVTSTMTPQNPLEGTEYCLEAQDITNTPLSSQCIDLSFVDYETGDSIDVEGFNLMLPYAAGVTRIVLKKGTQELTEQSVSPNAPTVTILSPNGGEFWGAMGTQTISWTGDDTDGDTLTYMVQYSPDGVKWIPVGGIVTETQITVNAAELAGGTQAMVKVMVTDGVNTRFDMSNTPFTVDEKGPQAFILNPKSEIRIPAGVPLLLQGYAYDLEDGMLNDAAQSWSSDLDGNLGTGSYWLAELSQGTHQITLSVMDSDGNIGIETITVYVGFNIYLPITRR